MFAWYILPAITNYLIIREALKHDKHSKPDSAYVVAVFCPMVNVICAIVLIVCIIIALFEDENLIKKLFLVKDDEDEE